MSKRARRSGPEVPGLLTVRQAADRKGVSTAAIYKAMETGRLHVQWVGEFQVLSEWEVNLWQPEHRGPKPRRRRSAARPEPVP